MDQKRQAGAGEVRSGGSEFGFVDAIEAFEARLGEEAFEAANTCFRERLEVVGVVAGDSTPCCPVDEALAVSGCALDFESRDRCSRGKAVERHVDQRGVAAGGGGAGGCGEALPLGAAGLVDVDVGVDKAGKERAFARDDVVEAGDGGCVADAGDSAVVDEHRAGADGVGRDDLWRDEGFGHGCGYWDR